MTTTCADSCREATAPYDAGLAGFARSLLDTADFPARWHCGHWSAGLGWLHITSDLAIFAAYASIPLTLAFFLVRRRDIPFPRLMALFAAFILFCGIGHVIEAMIFWHPVYRLAGLLKAVTATVSWVTVFVAIRILPEAMKLPDIARLNRQLSEEMQERRKAEESLRASEAQSRKLALVASRTDNAVVITDKRGRIEWVNDGFTRITGYARDEAVGRRPGSLLHGPDTDQEIVARMRDKISQGEGFQVEIVNYSKCGRKYWLAIEVQPFHDNAGQLDGFMAIESDITERKRAEDELETRVRERTADLARTNDELRASQERFEIVARATNDAVWDWDLVTDRLWWGDGLGNLFGYRNGALGHHRDSWAAAIHPDDRLRVEASIRKFFNGSERLWSGEYRFRRADGSHAHILDRGYVLRDDAGTPLRMIGAMMDITERKRSEVAICELNAKLEQRLDRINSLRQIDLVISGSLDLSVTLTVVLEQVRARLGVDAAAILVEDSNTGALTHAAVEGFRANAIAGLRRRLAEVYARRPSLERLLVCMSDPADSFPLAELFPGEDFVAYVAAPLVAKGQFRGMLEVYHRAPIEHDDEWLTFFEALASQAAIAIDNAALFDSLQRSNTELTAAYDATIEGWAKALDLRDKETEGHTRRVTEMTLAVARALEVSEEELVHIRRGALLHDIGKLAIPDDILLKPGRLTEAEWEIMRYHPQHAYDWLAPIRFLRPALHIPFYHHEKWDGTGYPHGLQGEQIPLAARIFAVVDIWDALRSDRPYRKGCPEERVRKYIRSLAGTHLDPAIVDAFLGLESVPAVTGGLSERRMVLRLPSSAALSTV